jgi:beta-lactamase class A
MSLKEVITEEAKGFNGVIGVSVKNLDTGEYAEVNGDMLFPTASVFKVPVIVEFFRQIDNNRIKIEDQTLLREKDKVPGSGILKELSEGMPVSYKDLLSLMMIVSDNTATDIIVKKVGFENINNTMRELGLNDTKVTKYCRQILFDLVGLNNLELDEMTINVFNEATENRYYSGSWSLKTKDNNVSTPKEMTRLLELITEGKAASEESCQKILEIMAKCQTGPYRIPKYLPSKEVILQRKTGSLPGIRNDVVIITIKERGKIYIISCFTREAENNYEAEEVIARISQKVYNYFSS